MTKVDVTTKEQLDELYKNSALTILGLAENSYQDYLDWIKEHTPLKSETIYVIKGKVMNENYNLTGINSYSSDLNIACVKLSDMEDYSKIVIPRFDVGGRWFDDVVDNNAMRQSKK